MNKRFKKISSLAIITLSFAFLAGQSNASFDVSNSTTGYNSANSIKNTSKTAKDIFNFNSQYVKSDKTGTSITGDNKSSANVGGGKLSTGAALVGGLLTSDFNLNKVEDYDCAETEVCASNDCTGADSCNEAETSVKKDIKAKNKNIIDLENDLDLKAVTGKNDSSCNTCGDIDIDTGDALAKAIVENAANENILKIGLAQKDPKVSASNSKTGCDSSNKAKASLLEKISVDNFNWADIYNDVDVIANTGENSANKNSGSVDIKTGDAEAEAEIENEDINKNLTEINVGSGDTEVSASNDCTGADSCNEAEASVTTCVDVDNKNFADIDNDVLSKANTGNNEADCNSCGDTNITTGDADSSVKIENEDINTNITTVNVGSGDTEVCASNDNTGCDSENKAEASLSNKVDVKNVNCADIDNNVTSIANTGGNSASFNNGCDTCDHCGDKCDCDKCDCDTCDHCGDKCDCDKCDCDKCDTCDGDNCESGGITTGDATSNVVISNQVNTNVTTINLAEDTEVCASNDCTGANSENKAKASVENVVSVTNINEAEITNNVCSISNTGNNTSDCNTGCGSIKTGDSTVFMIVDNSGNSNLTK